MRGSIQVKGNKKKIYYAVIALRGKRRWFRGPTKKDAQRILNETLTQVDNGTYKEIQKIAFREFAKLWLQSYAEGNLKPSTILGYQTVIQRRLVPFLGDRWLSDITPAMVQKYVAGRLKEVKPKTICNELVLMKRMFKHALRWGYLKSNPAELVDRPRLAKPKVEILEPDEIAKLLDKAEGPYRLAFKACILTGLRAGELWGLQWEDMDWNSWQIHVRRSLWHGQLQTTKSSHSVRRVDLPSHLISDLKKWKLACPISEHNLLFPSPEGKPSDHDNVVKRHFNAALRRAGLRHVSFHSLRHSNASMRIQAGQNIKYIQSQLGHSSVNITLDIYGHLFNDINFNRQQVELLETSFPSVRNPLENPAFETKKGLRNLPSP